MRVSVIGPVEASLLHELEPVVTALTLGNVARPSDAIVAFLAAAADLQRVARLKGALSPAGALWLIRPKGDPELTESAVMKAGRDSGLVDVKVMAFSPTHSTLKFVVPVRDRH